MMTTFSNVLVVVESVSQNQFCTTNKTLKKLLCSSFWTTYACTIQTCAKFLIHFCPSPAPCTQCCGNRRHCLNLGKYRLFGILNVWMLPLSSWIENLNVPSPFISNPLLIPSNRPLLLARWRSLKWWGLLAMHLDARLLILIGNKYKSNWTGGGYPNCDIALWRARRDGSLLWGCQKRQRQASTQQQTL